MTNRPAGAPRHLHCKPVLITADTALAIVMIGYLVIAAAMIGTGYKLLRNLAGGGE